MVGLIRWGMAAALFAASAGVFGQSAAAPTLQAMRAITPGNWSFHEPGTRTPARGSCIGDPAVFLRLRLRNAQCSRFVIDNSPATATVHYTCPGSGHVRTTIRVDTPRVLRIDSEGIIDGMPFADKLEARRTGACAGRGR